MDVADRAQWAVFGDWMREHRERERLSATEAAKRAGMSLTHWSRLENGTSGTSRKSVSRIAMALGADTKDAYQAAGFSAPASLDAYGLDDAFEGDIRQRLRRIPAPKRPAAKRAILAVLDGMAHVAS